MPARPKPSVDPALVPLIRALVRLALEDEERETADAAAEIAALRSTLGLEDDVAAWTRTANGLMAAFYRQVPQRPTLPLKARLRLVTAAVQELGANASYRRVAQRAGELAALEPEPPPRRRRRP